MATQLRIEAVGHLHRQQGMRDTDPVNRYKVEPLDRDVFIYGLLGGNAHDEWRITGRDGSYRTAQEALAVLQKEADCIKSKV